MDFVRLCGFGAAMTLVACGSSHSPGDGGAGERDGMVVRDGTVAGDDGGEACGPTTCGAGEVCCNASCGICVAPGGSCIDIACEDAGVMCGTETCGATELCCAGCDGDVFCAGGPVCPDVSCPVDTCGSSADCGSDAYCDLPGASCGGTGVCAPRPEGCPEDCPGVCGCDGRTYCNDCMAAAAGVDVSDDGCTTPPGGDCGGFAGMTCGARQWCDYPEGARCGAADATGTCRARPEGCPDVFDPVCGCDGVTYGNGCEANAAGTDTASGGPC